MRVLVAGATGAIGRELVPMLVSGGHEVYGTTRAPERAEWLRASGAKPIVLDVFDAAAVREAMDVSRPAVVIHQLTDLAAGFGPEQLRANARLRRVGTRHLVDAMLATSGRRLVAQSAAWLYAPGPTPRTEDDPLRDPEASPDDEVTPGILELERLVLRTAGIDGLVLRYGFLYGPGTANPTPRDISEGPYVHVTDAARAAALAVERGRAGPYNIVERADTVSNMRARKELGWEPMNRAGSATSRPERTHGS